MPDLLELSVEYRISGAACRLRLRELRRALDAGVHDYARELAIKRDITMLTAMTRDCIATSNYLKQYFERRQRLDWLREQETGK